LSAALVKALEQKIVVAPILADCRVVNQHLGGSRHLGEEETIGFVNLDVDTRTLSRLARKNLIDRRGKLAPLVEIKTHGHILFSIPNDLFGKWIKCVAATAQASGPKRPASPVY
jgi:hypothetical protein